MRKTIGAAAAAITVLAAAVPASAITLEFALNVTNVFDTSDATPIAGSGISGTGFASLTLDNYTGTGFEDFDETDISALSVSIFGQTFDKNDLADITNSTVPFPFDGPGVAFDAEFFDGILTLAVIGISEVTRVASPTGGVFEFSTASLTPIDQPGVDAFTGIYSSLLVPEFNTGLQTRVAPLLPMAVGVATTPVPLPGGLPLALAGVGALVFLRRRR